MAGKIRTFMRDQPFLAGCAGCLVSLGLICAGFGVLVAVGGIKIASCAGQGLDSATETYTDASNAGFMMGMSIMNGERTFSLEPMEPMEVSCADLEAIIFPHLTGELETVTLVSTSWTIDASGNLVPLPINCQYSGYPTAPTE